MRKVFVLFCIVFLVGVSAFAQQKYQGYNLVIDETGISFMVDTDISVSEKNGDGSVKVVRFDAQLRANASKTDGSDVLYVNYLVGLLTFANGQATQNCILETISTDTKTNTLTWKLTIPASHITGIENLSEEKPHVWLAVRTCFWGNALDTIGHPEGDFNMYLGEYHSITEFQNAGIPHKHEWVFSSDNGKLKAVCVSNDYRSNLCRHHNADNAVEIELQQVGFGSISVEIEPVNASSNTLVWTSSNSDFTVDEYGNVTAYDHGSSTITATAIDGSGVSASCEVYY